jgi:E3 ubiquitin-protein ligase RNF34
LFNYNNNNQGTSSTSTSTSTQNQHQHQPSSQTDRVPPRTSQPYDSNSYPFSNSSAPTPSSTTSTTSAPHEQPQPQPQQQPQQQQQQQSDVASSRPRRASLSDIKSSDDIESLTVRQIKEILTRNYVEFKGCCEKRELLDKLRRLYDSHCDNIKLQKLLDEGATSQMTNNNDESTKTDTGGTKKRVDESDVCKICMEKLMDCVLLECGHMVSCTECGKQLAECPVCRQNIVRMVRVFKS